MAESIPSTPLSDQWPLRLFGTDGVNYVRVRQGEAVESGQPGDGVLYARPLTEGFLSRDGLYIPTGVLSAPPVRMQRTPWMSADELEAAGVTPTEEPDGWAWAR